MLTVRPEIGLAVSVSQVAIDQMMSDNMDPWLVAGNLAHHFHAKLARYVLLHLPHVLDIVLSSPDQDSIYFHLME